jgi:hypothetical protein
MEPMKNGFGSDEKVTELLISINELGEFNGFMDFCGR